LASSSSRRPSLFERVGGIAYHHKWKVVAGWVAALFLLVVLLSLLGGKYASSFSIPGAESQKAADLLKERFPAQAGSSAEIVFHTDGSGPALSNLNDRITSIVEQAKLLPDVTAVQSPFETPGAISADGHTAFATVHYDRQASDLPAASPKALVSLVENSGGSGLIVEGGGQVVQQTESGGLASTELIGVAAAAVILVIAFGSVVAMGVPILAALISLGASIALIGLTTRFLDMTSFTPSFASMIGLGVGIDYALLVITRFREGLHRGWSVEQAVVTAVDTAGRSVLFAGAIVVIAMLGLTVIGIPFIAALGVAAAIVVAVSVLAALTLLPAVLGIIGHKVDSLAIPLFKSREVGHEDSMWFKLSHAIQKRPLWFAGIAAAFLLLLAVPFLSIKTAFTDAGNNAPTTHTRKAYDLLANGFGPGFNGPFTIVIDTTQGGKDAIPALSQALAKSPNVAGIAPPIFNQAGDTAIVTLFPKTAPQDSATSSLVSKLRDDVIPQATEGTGLHAYVAGSTAAAIDVSSRIASRTPLFFAMVIGLSFLVLMSVFRSIVIPIKAAIMNLLSVGAAYGVIVAVFQMGWGANLLGVQAKGPIEAFLPMMMFAVLFGLSMDYEVFLISRIKEEHSAGRKTPDAIAYGLSSTARVITSAALIMIAVFGSFALGDERVIKEFGLGLATAVFLDATVVRLLLVPATMELLGEANWWLPRWLDRILPKINVEGPAIEVPQPAGAPAATAATPVLPEGAAGGGV
jgi:RND superfamily putative drug exporter